MAKCKLSSIETLLFQALIDMDLNHEEFIAIFREKDIYIYIYIYKEMKKNVRNVSKKQENMRLNSVNSRA